MYYEMKMKRELIETQDAYMYHSPICPCWDRHPDLKVTRRREQDTLPESSLTERSRFLRPQAFLESLV